MERWIVYAIISMFFAGFTSVIAKVGLAGITSEVGLTVRTCFVFAFVLIFAAFAINPTDVKDLSWMNVGWLALSGVTTAVSWVFYYKAIHMGEVSTVALIDKGSFLVAVLMAWLVLGERISARTALGCILILVGLWVVSRQPPRG